MYSSKFMRANEKIAAGVTGGFNKMTGGIVKGFNKMTDGVVKGYTAIEDRFVGAFLAKEGETAPEAKQRLSESVKGGGDNE